MPVFKQKVFRLTTFASRFSIVYDRGLSSSNNRLLVHGIYEPLLLPVSNN